MLTSAKRILIIIFSLIGCFSLISSTIAVNSDFHIEVIPPSECNDTQDNDGDGLIDYPADPECSSLSDNFEAHQQCSDSYDNDSDSLIDYPADPGCSSVSDNDETDLFQCNDGIDNDGDGLIDYPSDPGCDSLSDNDETNGSSGNNGGGPGFVINPVTSVTFSGWAYPLSQVSVLKDGQLAVSTIAGPDAKFTVTISNLSSGNYNFSVFSEDNNGLKSTLFTFPTYISAGASTQVSGIFLAPTIDVDKSVIKKGETLTIFGQSVPNAQISVTVNSETEHFLLTRTNNSGTYLVQFDTSVLEFGEHVTKSKSSLVDEVSSFSKTVNFHVGTKTVEKKMGDTSIFIADFNGDTNVNLVDFSIMAFWYKRDNPPTEIDLNGDQKIDLIDFSIMAFYWTG